VPRSASTTPPFRSGIRDAARPRPGIMGLVHDEQTWRPSEPQQPPISTRPTARASMPRPCSGARGLLRRRIRRLQHPLCTRAQEPSATSDRGRLLGHLWMPRSCKGVLSKDGTISSCSHLTGILVATPVSPAVMVRSADRAQSLATSSKLDAPSRSLRSHVDPSFVN